MNLLKLYFLNTFFKSKLSLVYFLITLFVIIFSICSNQVLTYDSAGYINFNIIRSSGYPVFIGFHKFLFGAHFLFAIKCSQLVLIIIAIFYFLHCLKNTLLFNKFSLFIIFLTLLFPLVYISKIANSILSEGICYPLYLFTIGNFIQALINKKKNNYFFAALFLFFLIQCRAQFLFLIPIFFITILFFQRKTIFKKQNLILLFIFIIIPFFSVLADKTYHKLVHNVFITTPWTGIQISSLPFFVSDQDDYKLFTDLKQQEYFKLIYNNLKSRNLLLKTSNGYVDSRPNNYYSSHYQAIANETLEQKGALFFKTNTNSVNEQYIKNDVMASSVFFILLKDNIVDYLKIIFKNIFEGIGNFNSSIFLLILFLVSMFHNIENFNNQISKYIILVILLLVGNIFFIILAGAIIQRYVFYNYWILISIALVLINQFQIKLNE